MSRFVIGIIGYKGSGKTTAANVLAHSVKNAVLYAFAQPIKSMIATGFSVNPEEKHKPLYEGCKTTIGSALQTLGTEWGREIIDQNIWVRMAHERLIRLPEESTMVVHDVRFLSEAVFVRSHGGVLIRVLGNHGLPDGRNAKHVSELEGDEIVADIEVINDCALDMFQARIIEQLPRISEILEARQI